MCVAHWTIVRPGFDPRQRQRTFTLASMTRPHMKHTQPPVQWVPGVICKGLSAAKAWRWRGSSVTVKNEQELTPFPIGVCMAVAGQLFYFAVEGSYR